jgi:hypothetical protein
VKKLREAKEISELFYSGAAVQPGINFPRMSDISAGANMALVENVQSYVGDDVLAKHLLGF